MDPSTPQTCIEEIGRVAGLVWHTLETRQPMSFTSLAKNVDAPRDVVLLAVGWLAREDKVRIKSTKRGRIVSLR